MELMGFDGFQWAQLQAQGTDLMAQKERMGSMLGFMIAWWLWWALVVGFDDGLNVDDCLMGFSGELMALVMLHRDLIMR